MHSTTTQTGPATYQVPVPTVSPSTQTRTPPRPREKVLVCLHSDGFVEVYGEPHVDVKIVNVPECNPSALGMAEEYVELTIPRPYRDIYFPGMKRATELLRPLKPSDIAYRQWSVSLLREIQNLGKDSQ